jgi:hypothetical protein
MPNFLQYTTKDGHHSINEFTVKDECFKKVQSAALEGSQPARSQLRIVSRKIHD